MPINASVSGQPQIQANVGETQIDVSVSGGFGPSGLQGPAASIAVGTVTTGAPGSSASVVNAGTSSAAVLNFTIPQGPAGTTTWAGITDKPSTFAPSAHTHDDRYYTESEVDTLLAGKQGAGSYVLTTDARLSDARQPLTHTHTASQISDFTSAVIAAAPPTTNASLLTSGTLPDARLSSNIARTSDITNAVANVVNAAPASLDTLKELADALGNDASFATTVTNALASKAPLSALNNDQYFATTVYEEIATKAPLANPTFTGTVSGITKAMVGLGNVPNTDATARANHTGTQAWSTIVSTPTTLSGYGITDGVTTSDSRLSDARTPTAHNQAWSTITSTPTTLAGYGITDAVSSSDARLTDARTPLFHTHSASDLASGTVDIARLPVGTGSTQVAAGNDARFTDQRVPTDGSVTDAKITSGGLSTSSLNWAAIQPWAANTAYAKGDLVSFQGIAYRRSAAGTSGATFNVANWQQITPSEFVASQITSGTLLESRLNHVPLHPFLLMGG